MKKIFLLITVMFLFSCGSRKVETKYDKKEVKIENNEVKEFQKQKEFHKKEEVNTNSKEFVDEFEKIVEPLDPTKEMIVDGKSYTNAKLRTKKKSKTKDIQQKKTVNEKAKEKQEFKEVDKVTAIISEKSKSKKVDKKESFIFSIWFWLILIVSLFILRYLWKKYKNKIWYFY